MGKLVALVALALAVVVGLVLLVAVAAGTGPTGSTSTGRWAGASPPATPDPGVTSLRRPIPSAWLPLYQQAAATCPGLPWSILAAVGTVESGSGSVDGPGGVVREPTPPGPRDPCSSSRPRSRPSPPSGPAGSGPPSPYDPVDAVYSASALLCADGGGSATTLRAAIDAYNHSDDLRGHRADPVPGHRRRPHRIGHGGRRTLLRRRTARHALPVGRDRHRVGSTARA